MDAITLEINGQEISSPAGKTILEVVQEQKLRGIPTLCHSPELKPYGSCFLCVVEVAGRPNLVPACATRIAPGMKVETHNARVMESRKTALELLVSNHYADCLSPCKLGCPAGVDAQGYIALAAMGLNREAVDLVRETNPFPAICGRVCVRKCEVVCRRVEVDAPVGINNIKRYVTDSPGAYDGTVERQPLRGKSVGIVGSGPAGLTAAWFLGKMGYDPVVYEALPRTGGMLRYGIPTYRLPDDILDREVEYITRAGARIELGVRVGRDVTLDELRKKHDAVFIAAGAMAGKEMMVEGENETEGVVRGAEFLIEKTEDHSPLEGTIVVVGGGNTAMDVARTSWRLGAEKVIILYRRTKAEMPADKMEIEDCLKEGIKIMELAAPVGIVSENGKLKALKCILMKLGEPDASGRRRPVPIEGSEFELPCDIAVSAIGQESVLDGIAGIENTPAITRWKTVIVDTKTMKTNVEGVFAGGDVADDGPTVVIDAIRDGQRAAYAIHSFISGEPMKPETFIVRKDFWGKPGQADIGDVKETPRHEVHEIPVEEREGSFKEVSLGYEHEDVVHECDRCLSCGCVRYYDCALRLYSDEYGVDMARFAGYVRKHRVDNRHPHVSYDPNKCILCSRCIRTCAIVLPISALGLVGRGFKTEMRPAMNDPLAQTNCISCGSCIDSCPTGALTDKYSFPGRSPLLAEHAKTSCGLCSVGCTMTLHTLGEGCYWVSSSGVPGQYLCRYGRFGIELFLKQQRLEKAMQRSGGSHQKLEVAEGVEKAARFLKKSAEKHGPDAVAVFASPELSAEELYLAARIAREGLGTANIGSLTMLASGVDSGTLDKSIGFTASTTDSGAVKEADLIICDNTDTETDTLILSIEIMQAVRNGAKLITSSSSRNSLEALATLSLDPMRGRSGLLWNGILQALLDGGFISHDAAGKLPGGKEFLADMRDYGLQATAAATGVDERKLAAAAEMIIAAKRVVIVHSPDRPQDNAPGGIATIANLALLLNAAGVHADILLPYLTANGAGIELAGADPSFAPGRKAAIELPGAHSRNELMQKLADGSIKAALIIGEDPMQSDRFSSFFGNVEFTTAMDWAQTETTLFADIALPGTTYLEAEGTRFNYEGRAAKYKKVVSPPSGMQGWEVLAKLALAMGLRVPGTLAEITAELKLLVQEGTGARMEFYWNNGGRHSWDGQGKLQVADVKTAPTLIAPAMTECERYKRNIRDVGDERFRVL